jgi:hypothetical protein
MNSRLPVWIAIDCFDQGSLENRSNDTTPRHGRLKIDNKLELGRELNRQVGRFFAPIVKHVTDLQFEA